MALLNRNRALSSELLYLLANSEEFFVKRSRVHYNFSSLLHYQPTLTDLLFLSTCDISVNVAFSVSRVISLKTTFRSVYLLLAFSGGNLVRACVLEYSNVHLPFANLASNKGKQK